LAIAEDTGTGAGKAFIAVDGAVVFGVAVTKPIEKGDA
jgi:hypothetical protein